MMLKDIKRNLNVPNTLSAYRLLSFPLVLFFALTGQENLFVILFVINLITDIFDGLLARLLHQQTELGARLDSLADFGSYILAITGVFMYKLEEFKPHLVSFGIFLLLFCLVYILSLAKFKRMPSLHLFSWKIGGYIQGTFFFVLFVFGFLTPYYYFMIIWGITSFIESIIIQLILPELKSNQKGLYWVLKNR